MSDKSKPAPWDYFLTNYERDLLLLTPAEAVRKYPQISPWQLVADRELIRRSQGEFVKLNGQS